MFDEYARIVAVLWDGSESSNQALLDHQGEVAEVQHYASATNPAEAFYAFAIEKLMPAYEQARRKPMLDDDGDQVTDADGHPVWWD